MEISRFFYSHGTGRNRTICARGQKGEGVPDHCHICKLSDILDDWELYIGAKPTCLVYGHVYATNASSDYWAAGNTYCIIGNKRLQDSIITMLGTLVDDAQDFLISMLTPTHKGAFCSVELTKGAQGKCSIQVIPGVNKDPIFNPNEEMPKWYKPLNELWVPAEFDVTRYRNSLKVIIRKNMDSIIPVELENGIDDEVLSALILEVKNEIAEDEKKQAEEGKGESDKKEELKSEESKKEPDKKVEDSKVNDSKKEPDKKEESKKESEPSKVFVTDVPSYPPGILKAMGFASNDELKSMITSVEITTPEQKSAFESWLGNDGSKAGLQLLVPGSAGQETASTTKCGETYDVNNKKCVTCPDVVDCMQKVINS